MSEWISKVTCAKCKKKGHISFNCPPKYGNKFIKSKYALQKRQTYIPKKAAHLNEFAGRSGDINHGVPKEQGVSYLLFDDQKNRLIKILPGHNIKRAKKFFLHIAHNKDNIP